MRKHRRAILIAEISAVLAVIIAAIICFNWQFRYIVSDSFSHIFKPGFAKEADIETVNVTLEDLKNDSRVVFNQAVMLINTQYMLPENFVPEISEYKDTGVYMNSCAVNAFGQLSSEVAERFDEKLYVSSAFRTADEQAEQIKDEGEAAQQVGASEHQAGLGTDVYILYYGGKAFLKHEAGRWVNSNCSDFGFIIRYPYYGKGSTGIGYEPWHIRYVGLPHSQIIAKNSLTLEEYLEKLKLNTPYIWENWIIIRTDGNNLCIPKDFESAEVSPDNTGGYVMTFRISQ